MNTFCIGFCLAFAVASSWSDPTAAQEIPGNMQPMESRVPVGNASLYVRTVGQGRSVIVLHGGPDFDHYYLLPELDRLQDAFRLIYYDQRGRGDSAAHVQPEDVTLASDLDDLDQVRRHFGLQAPVLLGHSWGTVLALEYALRHPRNVSALILMNPAPVSASGVAAMRRAYIAQLGREMDRQREIVAGNGYQQGDPDAVIARYHIHFEHALARRQDYDALMARMAVEFRRQGAEGILKSRAIEARLMRDTWQVPGYDLLPKLRDLHIPTLVIVGNHDLVPVDVAAHIAQAMPDAKLVTIRNCGHFSYLECPSDVRSALDAFFRTADDGSGPVPSHSKPMRAL